LPPYPTLDAILYRLVEKEMRLSDIVADGFDAATVRRVEGLLYLAEYKRRQSAPGVKVGSKNFGRDRRYPIDNRFRDSVQPAQTPDASIAPRGAQGTSERFED
jgi:NAD+ synthase